MKENPFRYGQVVTGEYFTNREDEIKEISEEIVSGQNIILISPRRYGKTSVVINAVSKIKYPFIKIDVKKDER
jgi:AAA+ ATPase superfamily predicted ATPase